MSYEATAWVGASEFAYVFHIYARGEQIPSRPGVFIYAKQDGQGVWYPVYMGQGDLSVCCDEPALLARIDEKNATHIHMRLCSAPEDRAEELADLLKRYQNSFVPYGCNVPEPA